MKKQTRELDEILMMVLPPVIIAAGWFALWLVWPNLSKIPAGKRQITKTVFKFASVMPAGMDWYSMPDMIVYSSPAGFAPAAAGNGSVVLDMPDIPAAAPKFLDRGTPALRGEAEGRSFFAEGSSRPPAMKEPFTRRHAVADKPAAKPGFVVELPETMKERNFEMQELKTEEIKPGEKPWESVIHVHIGKDGMPENIFVEKGTGNAELDAVLCMKVFGGKALPGTAFSGRVMISYGLQ